MSLEAVGDWLARARTLVQSGDVAAARMLLGDAMRAYPAEPTLANAAGDLAIKAGDVELAERHFAAARKHSPANIEYGLNHAIALQKLDARTALWSQVPMTGLMISYTVFGLWLLSTPVAG